MAQTTLSDRVALVTGGGRGIGRAVALALGRAGAAVAITARTRAQLEAIAAELKDAGAAAVVISEMDVADPDALAAGLERIRAAFPRIDVLVNNAGIAESAPPARTGLALWERHLAVNATALQDRARARDPLGPLQLTWITHERGDRDRAGGVAGRGRAAGGVGPPSPVRSSKSCTRASG